MVVVLVVMKIPPATVEMTPSAVGQDITMTGSITVSEPHVSVGRPSVPSKKNTTYGYHVYPAVRPSVRDLVSAINLPQFHEILPRISLKGVAEQARFS